MKKKAIIAGIILSSVNFSAQADDFMTYFPTPEFKSFKIEKSLESSPAVSQLYINAVISSSAPNGERITPKQKVTKIHHRGPLLYVSTVEIGYAHLLITTMNGNRLPESSMINAKALCADPRGKIDPCKGQGLIVGYWRIWDVSKFGAGNFEYHLTSIEYPWNSEHTKITIL